ncbi:MAG: type II CAAX prenyl endopeptidase Rce1 family protein [Candidatus Limnocylindrales bacterium]
MGRTIGHGTQALSAARARRRARQLAREMSAAAGPLTTEAARLEADAEVVRERLAPLIEETRRVLQEGEARLAPALMDAREQAARGAEEVSSRLYPLLAESAQLAERSSALVDRAAAITTLAATKARTAAQGRRTGTAVGMPAVLASRPSVGAVALGVGAAQAAFAATFRGPRERFWPRMTMTGLALGAYAIVALPALRRTRIRRLHVLLGASSAAVLYSTFTAGDRFVRQVVPGGSRDIADIYALRELQPRSEIALRLVTIIAPAEELFWRGMVQEGLMFRFGRWRGAALATAAYAGVHAVTGNLTLVGAAGVAGAHWSALYAAGVPLGALIVSHQLWDVWIFLVQPTGDVGPSA